MTIASEDIWVAQEGNVIYGDLMWVCENREPLC